MAKPSSDCVRESINQIVSPTANISKDVSPEFVDRLLLFLAGVGVTTQIPDHFDTNGVFSEFVSSIINPLSISPGRLTCLITVKPAVTVNLFIYIYIHTHIKCCFVAEKILGLYLESDEIGGKKNFSCFCYV